MDAQLLVICLLTFVIHLIGTLAYAARIAGVRTRRIAMSFALFNVLVLVSRTANGFLGPFLAKRVENRLQFGGGGDLAWDFRLVLLSASLAVLVGIVLVPTAQRLFAVAIGHFQRHRSTGRMLLRSASPTGVRIIRESIAAPSRATFTGLGKPRGVSWTVLAANALAQALLVVGVLASIYAGYLNPEFRVTASQLSAVINGVATILLFALIDPQISVMTDDVVDGKTSEAEFRRTIVWISFSRLAGTVLAQAVFIPGALAVAWIAGAF
ncbi:MULTISPECIES: lipid II flippase Amj family protein [Citromicrobium]|uniref:lipid II flippase Amj family protein n=1 Tax=Citromicrobium TaxID=72173 RepID=UPI0001DD1067|nr:MULTISPECIES: lipid II flippase Amj family protein [Citromicrobium]ALG61087.1 membrane protein [Citromicrobium sp. JL477]KPM15248.1 membrane protein [Citromicrobium sp. JL1351]KPM19607.1 membrane protein [Citromicrobium sp. JL31]KPM26334.1 membrane protein [Citromicrobium sp. JL2201]